MAPRASNLRIVVTGIVGSCPVGGVAWDYLQYPIGLARLGHDVVYHEDTRGWPYDPVQNSVVDTASYSVDYIARFFQKYAPDLGNRWHYRHLGKDSFGLSESEFDRFARSADLFLNVSAANPRPGALSSRCVKAYLDTDPGFNQIVLAEPPPWTPADRFAWLTEEFKHYDRHLTYAENIGREDCLVPVLGVDWITTRMPIVDALWRNVPAASDRGAWTTVMTWNNFPGRLVHAGREYGDKGVEFSKIIALPKRTSHRLKIALGGDAAPLQELLRQGWTAVDAPKATLTPESYQGFIAESRGEISTAKNVYVAMRTGWFSCRTACYLAAGRPAVVQDTGFSKTVPVGKGLFAFDTIEQAAAAIESVESDYRLHAAAARDLAVDQFGSDKVLTRMLEDIYSAGGAAR